MLSSAVDASSTDSWSAEANSEDPLQLEGNALSTAMHWQSSAPCLTGPSSRGFIHPTQMRACRPRATARDSHVSIARLIWRPAVRVTVPPDASPECCDVEVLRRGSHRMTPRR